jgi:hypothetical protein
VDFRTISKAAAALAQLSTDRRDDYDDWLYVGMSLKDKELDDDIGVTLWELWSKDSPSYRVGDCAKKWRTFRVGVPGGTDITLASLYKWAKDDAGEFKHETGNALDDAERLQLQAYQARDVQTQRILAMDAPMSAKAVIVGMLPRLEAKRALVAENAEHSGSLSVNYGTFADVMRTSKGTVKRAVDVGEKAGLWRKDAEHVETKAGYDMLVMRLDLQPAFYHPEQATPIEQKPRGGARPGAGRKPICPDCPSGTVHRKVTSTMVTYHCAAHGEIGVEHLSALVEEYVSGTDEFKHETGTAPLADAEHVETQHDAPAAHAENADDFKHETGYTVGGPTLVSCLKKTHADADDIAPFVDVWTAREEPPSHSLTLRERLDAAMAKAARV